MSDPIAVFISYSHDSESHKDSVLNLAYRLRKDGIDCVIDQYEESPPQGWPQWMIDQIERADFVLVVCTQTYARRFNRKDPGGPGKGAKWEGAIITQEVYDAHGRNMKFIPVVFKEADAEHIPVILRGATRYNPTPGTGYDSLYRRLTGQPLVVKPPLGRIRPMAPQQPIPSGSIDPPPSATQAGSPSSAVEQRAAELPTEDGDAGRSVQNASTDELSLAAVARYSGGLAVRQTMTSGGGGLPPSVKRQAQRFEKVELLLKELQRERWVALHGPSGCGKTQLALLVATTRGGRTAWVRLGSRAPDAAYLLDGALSDLAGEPGAAAGFRELSVRACRALGSGAVLVLDDLPSLPGGELATRLVELALACREHGIGLLTTSASAPLPTARDLLGSNDVFEYRVPPFDEAEALDLFRAYGMPDAAILPEHVKLVVNLSRGHPVLLAAAARYLSDRDWKFSEAELDGLIHGEHLTDVSSETLSRLLLAIEETPTRDLLYRINLADGVLSLDDVDALAAVSPSIDRPRERVHRLTGFCLQAEAAGAVSVSPLFRILGAADVPPHTRKACHGVLGATLVSRGSLNEVMAFQAISHFVAAEDWGRAGSILVIALSAILRAGNRGRDMGFSSLWVDRPLPVGMDLGMRIVIRSMQAAVRRRQQRDAQFVERDFDRLVAEAGPGEAVAILAAVTNIRGAKTDAARARLFLTSEIGLRLLNQTSHERSALSVPEDFEPQLLLWSLVRRVKRPDDLRGWIAAAEALTDAQRRALFAGNGEHLSMTLANRIWLNEASRPVKERQWQPVREALADLAAAAQRWGAEVLWANAVRAQMIVVAEYLKDVAEAVGIGERAVAVAPATPVVQFLLRECIGRQLYYAQQHVNARPWLEQAVAQPTRVYSVTHVNARLNLSASIGDADPQAAVKHAAGAVTFARQALSSTDDPVPPTELVKALAELAVAQWRCNDLSAVFSTWDEAADRLLQAKSGKPAWIELFVIFCHVSGYFSMLARLRERPNCTLSGDEYGTPYRGLFATTNEDRVKWYTPEKEPYLSAQLAMFASAVGDDERAATWAARTLASAAPNTPTVLSAVMQWEIVPAHIRASRFDDAISTAVRAATLQAASMESHKAGGAFEAVIDENVALGPRPGPRWLTAERQAALIVLPAVISSLGSKMLSSDADSTARVAAARAADACRVAATNSVDPHLWDGAAAAITHTFFQDGSDLIAFGNSYDAEEHKAVRAIAYLGASIADMGDLRKAIQAHLAVMPLLDEFLTLFPGLHRLLVQFVADYWTLAASTMRFRFVAPSIVTENLRRASDLQGSAKLRHIITVMASGLGVQPDSPVRAWLDSGRTVPR